MLKFESTVDVDAFIKQATKIPDKYKGNSSLRAEARHEAAVLLRQLEDSMEDKGLEASDNS